MTRRPLTVRRWFRVALVLICIVGGYAAAYLVLRETTVTANSVYFMYPVAQRVYSTSEWTLFDRHGRPLQSGSMWQPRFGRVQDTKRVAFRSYEGSTCAPCLRAFYPLERFELWVRGIRVYDAAPSPDALGPGEPAGVYEVQRE